MSTDMTANGPKASSDYGSNLYGADWFENAFPHFGEHQALAAKALVERIFAHCGGDPDLPYVDTLIYYGCGDGSLLEVLIAQLIENKECKKRIFKIWAFDCSKECVNKAKEKCTASNAVTVVAQETTALTEALKDFDIEILRRTAVLILGHTWFHLDQEDTISALMRHRPALLLIDVHQKWDYALSHLPYTVGYSSSEQGGDNYALKTEEAGSGRVRRSVVRGQDEIFHTIQAKVLTHELLGLSIESEARSDQDCQTILSTQRDAGTLTGAADYVCRRLISHESGWGPMDCYCLVPRDPLAKALNDAYSRVLQGLIDQCFSEEDRDHACKTHKAGSQISSLLRIFDEPELGGSREPVVTGCRIAVGILPFDDTLTFCRFYPLFPTISKGIGEHELLAEQPSSVQQRFPSAYGVYQTFLSRSSCPQAFTLKWATDYDHTAVDRAFERMEENAIGISALRKLGDENGIKFIDDENPPSFFMVPVYFGSLPLFALALRFPAFFDPSRTGFDVFFSTLASLNDSIKVLMTPELITRNLIRPWIEYCLSTDHKDKEQSLSMAAKLNEMEWYLFGKALDDSTQHSGRLTYRLGDKLRAGGVLSKEWKSWILGLPSFPINKMAKVIEENRRLWEIWVKEKEIALLDPALRISLWFQDGRFFEDKAHEEFVCSVHLPRLLEIFSDLGWKDDNPGTGKDSWLSRAVGWLTMNYSNDDSSIARYFGKENTKHFLFRWLIKQLKTLANGVKGCNSQDACCAAGSSAACSCAAKEPFDALKAVFCKTNANTGPGVRFDLIRLWHLLDAARSIKAGPAAGNLTPSTPKDLTDKKRLLPSKFWSADDPSIHIAELVQCLARMRCPKNLGSNILENIQLSIEQEVTVAISIKIELKANVGGSDKHKLDQCADQVRKHCTLGDIHNTKEIKIRFSVTPEGEFKPVTETAS